MKKDKVIKEVLGEESGLSPNDLYNKQFTRVTFGGYDRKEVDDYLERAADRIDDLMGQIRALREKLEEQRKQLEEYKDLEATMRNAIVSSQRYGDDIIESAKREAHAVMEEARVRKEQAQLDAMKLPASLQRDIHLLEQQRTRIRVELQSILETHKPLLDSLVPAESNVQVAYYEPLTPAQTQAPAPAPVPQPAPAAPLADGPLPELKAAQWFAGAAQPAQVQATSAPAAPPQSIPQPAAQPQPVAQPEPAQEPEVEEEEAPIMHWKMDT
ncbi:MAG: DivIVA domain-containing protein [Candidatus Hydrogenedentales bacterium]|jgi:DivIVA domain-containing protein